MSLQIYGHMKCIINHYLFYGLLEENDARNYLDQVDRGGNTGLRQGQIYWCIDNAEHHFTDCKFSTSNCRKYILNYIRIGPSMKYGLFNYFMAAS